MKFSQFLALASVPLALANVLARQDGQCNEDNCLRAVAGTVPNPDQPFTATSHCLSYFVETIGYTESVFTETSTKTLTFTARPTPRKRDLLGPKRIQLAKRQETSVPTSTTKTIPPYATAACTSDHYQSACSCLGVTATSVTLNTTKLTTRTITITTYETVTATTTQTGDITTGQTITTRGVPSETGTSGSASSSQDSSSSVLSSSTAIWSNSSTIEPTGTVTSTSLVTNGTTTESPTPTSTCDGIPGLSSCYSNVTMTTTCVDLKSDPLNCGSCGYSCPGNSTCTNGLCNSNSCSASVCGSFETCGGTDSCVCGSIVDGTGFCVDGNTECSSLADCDTSSDCPLGQICAVESCCLRNVCIGEGNGTCAAGRLSPIAAFGGAGGLSNPGPNKRTFARLN